MKKKVYRFPVVTLIESRDGKGRLIFNKKASALFGKNTHIFLSTGAFRSDKNPCLYFTLFDHKVEGSYKLFGYDPSHNLGCNYPLWLFPRSYSGHYRLYRISNDTDRYAIKLNQPLEKEEENEQN